MVNIGDGNSAQGILSPVTVTNTGGTTRLNINNAADFGNRTVTVAPHVTGLSPGAIFYSNLSALVLNGGGLASTYTVTGTAAGIATTLNAGGDDMVNVQATTGDLTVNCVGASCAPSTSAARPTPSTRSRGRSRSAAGRARWTRCRSTIPPARPAPTP